MGTILAILMVGFFFSFNLFCFFLGGEGLQALEDGDPRIHTKTMNIHEKASMVCKFLKKGRH